jgi:hypothetical protein
MASTLYSGLHTLHMVGGLEGHAYQDDISDNKDDSGVQLKVLSSQKRGRSGELPNDPPTIAVF